MRKSNKGANTMFGTYQPDVAQVRRNRQIIAVMVLCIAGLFFLLLSMQFFWISLKPGYDVEYLLENDVREGMHVKGQVPYTYDCFADMSDLEGGKVSYYYYALPAAEGMMILKVPVSRQREMETLLEETLDYLDTGIWPTSVVELEGYVTKAQGRLPYLLSEYMTEIGYTQEEIEAMGEPMMIEDASGRIEKARINAPVGIILMAAGVLLGVFFCFWNKRKS